MLDVSSGPPDDDVVLFSSAYRKEKVLTTLRLNDSTLIH